MGLFPCRVLERLWRLQLDHVSFGWRLLSAALAQTNLAALDHILSLPWPHHMEYLPLLSSMSLVVQEHSPHLGQPTKARWLSKLKPQEHKSVPKLWNRISLTSYSLSTNFCHNKKSIFFQIYEWKRKDAQTEGISCSQCYIWDGRCEIKVYLKGKPNHDKANVFATFRIFQMLKCKQPLDGIWSPPSWGL